MMERLSDRQVLELMIEAERLKMESIQKGCSRESIKELDAEILAYKKVLGHES